MTTRRIGWLRSTTRIVSPGILAGAYRSAVKRHTGCTQYCLMLGREVNSPATLQFRPPPEESDRNGWGMGSGHKCDEFRKIAQWVSGVGQGKIVRSSKVDKETLHIRERQYNVGDLVYWSRNAVKMLESIWLGPVVVIAAKFDTICQVQTRRNVL